MHWVQLVLLTWTWICRYLLGHRQPTSRYLPKECNSFSHRSHQLPGAPLLVLGPQLVASFPIPAAILHGLDFCAHLMPGDHVCCVLMYVPSNVISRKQFCSPLPHSTGFIFFLTSLLRCSLRLGREEVKADCPLWLSIHSFLFSLLWKLRSLRWPHPLQ